MIILRDILFKVAIEAVYGRTDIAINKIVFDSREVKKNDVFVAIKGTFVDGHDYIKTAINLGASVVICNTFPDKKESGVTYIVVHETREASAFIVANYYGNPSHNLKLVGVTGTNGKTTVATLLYELFKKAGYKVGLFSTVKILIDDDEVHPVTHTTPDSITINSSLKQMNEVGVEFCFMEVSSHGIHQHRVTGLLFSGGIFTNLSHDHLDYHVSFAAYRDVKKMFFDRLPETAFALSNIDNKNGMVMLQNTKARKVTYALKSYAHYMAQVLENQLSGLLLKINGQEVWAQLIGIFNAYNLLAVYGAAIELGLDKFEVLQLISELRSVWGRFQFIISNQENITVIVDYAHTPDALENVLKTINEIKNDNEQLLVVVGCGGDRDRAKRPLMAHVASSLGDKIILTSDNPRSENPETIIREMEKGIIKQNHKKVLSITDRRQAIKTACQLAGKKDIILIAGKGHETYQEIKGERYDFDDMKMVREFLEQLNK